MTYGIEILNSAYIDNLATQIIKSGREQLSSGSVFSGVIPGYNAGAYLAMPSASPSIFSFMPFYNSVLSMNSYPAAFFNFFKSTASKVVSAAKGVVSSVASNISSAAKISLSAIESKGLKFTHKSCRDRWNLLDAKLQTRLEKLVEYAKSKGITISIYSSFRTEAQQQSLVKKGAPAAKKGSRHLSGKAVDIRVSGNKKENLALLGKYWKEVLGGRWGGDFKHPTREPWHFDIA